VTRRHLLLGAVLGLPVALLVLAADPGGRLRSLALAAPIVAGLIALDRALRAYASEGTALWTVVLGTFGTGLFPLVAHAPDGRRAIAFLLGAIGVAALGRERTPLRLSAFAAASLAGLAMAPIHFGGSGLARAWFGSRGGLLFETPLLWGALLGLALLARRDGRAAAPLAALGALPFLVAPVAHGPIEAALPALLVGLAVALESLAALVARRPSVLAAIGIVLIALSNLAFMEQYRHTLRRDDTVSFPQVSEGNARLVARAVGSPNAWPANWLWSARTGLPVERWDLLSAQRLDPAAGVRIDVGDLGQDAAFLLDGWSVRHECGAAICREVEGRAEIVVPLDRAGPADLYVLAVGAGRLRVSVNAGAPATIDLDGEAFLRGPIRTRWRAGVNRVVLEASNGPALVDGLRIGPAGTR
jgi:hypothetical protein